MGREIGLLVLAWGLTSCAVEPACTALVEGRWSVTEAGVGTGNAVKFPVGWQGTLTQGQDTCDFTLVWDGGSADVTGRVEGADILFDGATRDCQGETTDGEDLTVRCNGSDALVEHVPSANGVALRAARGAAARTPAGSVP
jgi:hypothetical protein